MIPSFEFPLREYLQETEMLIERGEPVRPFVELRLTNSWQRLLAHGIGKYYLLASQSYFDSFPMFSLQMKSSYSGYDVCDLSVGSSIAQVTILTLLRVSKFV